MGRRNLFPCSLPVNQKSKNGVTNRSISMTIAGRTVIPVKPERRGPEEPACASYALALLEGGGCGNPVRGPPTRGGSWTKNFLREAARRLMARLRLLGRAGQSSHEGGIRGVERGDLLRGEGDCRKDRIRRREGGLRGLFLLCKTVVKKAKVRPLDIHEGVRPGFWGWVVGCFWFLLGGGGGGGGGSDTAPGGTRQKRTAVVGKGSRSGRSGGNWRRRSSRVHGEERQEKGRGGGGGHYSSRCRPLR